VGFGICGLSRRPLAVAMVVVMAVALVTPGASNTPKNVLARHLPSHCETLASLGLRLVKIWIFVFMASHKQVFRLRETTTSRRLEFLLNSGPQKRSSRARETPTFRKMEKT